MSHCQSCNGYTAERKNGFPVEFCRGCGHENLEAKLAEAQATVEYFTAHGMADVRALWANGRVCDSCSHALCVFFREAIFERDALKATLEQVRVVLQALVSQRRYVLPDDFYIQAVAFLNAGKKTSPSTSYKVCFHCGHPHELTVCPVRGCDCKTTARLTVKLP